MTRIAIGSDQLSLSTLSLAVVLGALASYLAWRYVIPRSDRLPGPPALPIIGSLPWMRNVPFDVKCREFRQRYGPTFEVYQGMQRYVVCSGEDARTLLLGAPSNRSEPDRPDLLFYSQELGTDKWFPPSVPSKEPFVHISRTLAGKVTRMTKNSLGEETSAEFLNALMKRVRQEAASSGSDSAIIDLEHVVLMYARSVALQTAFGIHLPLDQIETHYETKALLECVQGLLTLFDSTTEISVPFPFLRYLWPTRTAARRKEAAQVFHNFLEAGRALSQQYVGKVRDDQGALNVTSEYHLAKEGVADNVRPLTEEDCIIQGAGIIAATADTTPYSICILIGCLAYDKASQRRIQREVDEAMKEADLAGDPTALPTIDLLASVPYVNACLTESMRLFAFSPMSFPRRVVSDTPISNGRVIRKGTIVIGHYDLMSRDPAFCKDHPDEWRPERQMNADTKAPTFSFGVGSRACPGRDLALRNMAVFVARLFYLFDVDFAEPIEDKTMEQALGLNNDTLTRKTTVSRIKLTPRQRTAA